MDTYSFMPIIMTDLNKPWEKVLSLGVPMTFSQKSVISSTGKKQTVGLYFIRRGCIRLSNVSLGGQDKVLFYLGHGTLFNEIPMLQLVDNYIFTCMEHTEAVFLPQSCITTKFIREYPDLMLNLLESMSKKSQFFYSQLCCFQQLDTFTNVCRTLFSMHLHSREGDTVVPRLTQLELASYLGVHRSSLHKTMVRLKREGVIGDYCKNKLEIRDPDKLWNYSQEGYDN